MATLVNGNGNVAVYAQQDADLLTGALGASTRIMNVGSKMAYTIEDANTIAVADGVILTKEGRRIQVDVGNVDEFTIPTGSAGVTRYYIIGYHLYTDGSANQKCETFVQLMENGSETITENTFRNGASEVYVSLYRVKQIGLNLDTITALLSVGIALTDMTDVIGDTDISGIGDGTLTGGLYAVNQNLTELGTIKYDEVSDNVYVKRDGMWVVWKKAYLDNLYIYSDGQFKSSYSIGVDAVSSSGFTNNAPLTLANDSLYIEQYVKADGVTTNYGGGSWINGTVDLTNYTYLKANITSKSGTQDISVNVSSLTGNYQIVLNSTEYNSVYGAYFALGVNSSPIIVSSIPTSQKTVITAAQNVSGRPTRTTITINSLWLE